MSMTKTLTQSTLISSFQALSIIDLTLNIREDCKYFLEKMNLKADICHQSNGLNSVKKLYWKGKLLNTEYKKCHWMHYLIYIYICILVLINCVLKQILYENTQTWNDRMPWFESNLTDNLV